MDSTIASSDLLHANDILFPLIGALWACCTLIFNATLECNKIRDRVILADDEHHRIDAEYREHLMRNDWRPYAISVFFVCVAFAVLALWTPRLLPEAERSSAWPIACWVALFSVMMAICWAPTARRDWRAMRKAVEKHHANARNA